MTQETPRIKLFIKLLPSNTGDEVFMLYQECQITRRGCDMHFRLEEVSKVKEQWACPHDTSIHPEGIRYLAPARLTPGVRDDDIY